MNRFLALATLAAHLRALADGAARPADAVPDPHRDLLDAAWQATA